MPQPLVIGLVGGIASGKSTIARMLQALGALWLDSDALGHAVLETAEVKKELVKRFGKDALNADGTVSRRQVAQHVFGDTQQATEHRRWLEQLVHPRIRHLTEQRIAREGDRYPAVIIDAPLLLEAGWAPRCHHIVLIDTPREIRETLAAQRGWSLSELEQRAAAQMPLDEKRRYATEVIINDGSIEQLKSRVEEFWRRLVGS